MDLVCCRRGLSSMQEILETYSFGILYGHKKSRQLRRLKDEWIGLLCCKKVLFHYMSEIKLKQLIG